MYHKHKLIPFGEGLPFGPLNQFLSRYIKNISFIKLDGTNFSLNDEEFKEVELISKEVSPETLLLFWQFTIKSLDELDIVSNQNLSIEMFLIRLIHLIELIKDKSKKNIEKNSDKNFLIDNDNKINQIEDNPDYKNKTISQIKNVSQEEKYQTNEKADPKKGLMDINNFDELINLFNEKKQIQLKYELETNVNLVSFDKQRIEISFNENLDKNFIKDLTAALFHWTNKRWIIALSKKNGELSKKEKKEEIKSKLISEAKTSDFYDKIIKNFPDAELLDVEEKKND